LVADSAATSEAVALLESDKIEKAISFKGVSFSGLLKRAASPPAPTQKSSPTLWIEMTCKKSSCVISA
jgi:hypothetical protein